MSRLRVFQFAVLMWLLTYVGALFNGLTLLILGEAFLTQELSLSSILSTTTNFPALLLTHTPLQHFSPFVCQRFSNLQKT